MNIFGNKDALIGSIDLAIGAVFVLGALVFRKTVANDMLETDFSVIGSSAAGILCFIILKNFLAFKIAIGLGIIAWLLVGFLLPKLINIDGSADGSDSEGDEI
jgi:hypothetical protein